MGVLNVPSFRVNSNPDQTHSFKNDRDADPRQLEADLRRDALEPVGQTAISELIGELAIKDAKPEELLTDPASGIEGPNGGLTAPGEQVEDMPGVVV